jgi:hypothetical protein
MQFNMSTIIGSIEPFVPGSNFKGYEDRVNQFFLVNNVKSSDKTIMGNSMYELLMSLTMPELPSKKSFESLTLRWAVPYKPLRERMGLARPKHI